MDDTLVPINDLARLAPETAARLSASAGDVIRRGHYVLGPEVAAFEKEFAAYCGVAHCVGVANGTDALELALRALGVDGGHRVVVAANAGMYGTTAVLAIGAEPVFADVDPEHGLMTPESFMGAVDQVDGPIDVVIVTHLYGRLADMPAFVDHARARGIAVVEDCAQAHGATDRDERMAGSFGDAACFSFYPTKNLGAIGDGGAVLCNDADLAGKVRQLRQYGWSAKYTNQLPGGRNSRLDELQAAFLRHLLPMLAERNTRRRDIANRYSREIRNARIALPPVSSADYVAHLYVVQSDWRDGLAAHLSASGIASDVHYPVPDHRQPVHASRFATVALPATEALCQRVLTLPCFPELRDDEVERVIKACNAWDGTLSEGAA